MTKKLDNMTMDERMAFFEKKREQERKERQKIVNQVPVDLLASVIQLHKWAESIAHDGIYTGVKYIPAYELQELEAAADQVKHNFNIET